MWVGRGDGNGKLRGGGGGRGGGVVIAKDLQAGVSQAPTPTRAPSDHVQTRSSTEKSSGGKRSRTAATTSKTGSLEPVPE